MTLSVEIRESFNTSKICLIRESIGTPSFSQQHRIFDSRPEINALYASTVCGNYGGVPKGTQSFHVKLESLKTMLNSL